MLPSEILQIQHADVEAARCGGSLSCNFTEVVELTRELLRHRTVYLKSLLNEMVEYDERVRADNT